MGLRGPKPGYRRQQADSKAAAELASVLTAPSAFFAPPAQLRIAGPKLTTWQRENPNMLAGEALRELGYRNGMARSQMATMSDEKIRLSMRYIIANRAEAG